VSKEINTEEKVQGKITKLQEEETQRAEELRHAISEHEETFEKLNMIFPEDDRKMIQALASIDVKTDRNFLVLESKIKDNTEKASIFFTSAAIIILIGVIVSFVVWKPLDAENRRQITREENNETIEMYSRMIIIADKNISKNDANHTIVQQQVVLAQSLIDRELSLAWKNALMEFVKAFTFYGFLVMFAVLFLKRSMGLENDVRRFSVELFEHLSFRKFFHAIVYIGAEKMKILMGNKNIPTDEVSKENDPTMKAPMGALFEELFKTMTEIAKSFGKK
jgi:hypothetical protein